MVTYVVDTYRDMQREILKAERDISSRKNAGRRRRRKKSSDENDDDDGVDDSPLEGVAEIDAVATL
jgi:hypothetical protein